MGAVVVVVRWLQGFFKAIYSSGYNAGQNVKENARQNQALESLPDFKNQTDQKEFIQDLVLAAESDIQNAKAPGALLRRGNTTVISFAFDGSKWGEYFKSLALIQAENLGYKLEWDNLDSAKKFHIQFSMKLSEEEITLFENLLSQKIDRQVSLEYICGFKGLFPRVNIFPQRVNDPFGRAP